MGERLCADRGSVPLGEGGHSWQGVGRQRQGVEDAVMNAHGFVFPKDAVGAQLGQPYVENLLALCLESRKRETQSKKKLCRSVNFLVKKKACVRHKHVVRCD